MVHSEALEQDTMLGDNGLRLRVKGKVQGVGFRPYIWLLAQRFNLRGEVSNDGAGVVICLWSSPDIAEFLRILPLECPPLARVDSVISQPFCWQQEPKDFAIVSSGAGPLGTHIVADAATCACCLQELNSPSNRRYHYPFINCTHCGPRFTIIYRMPYDRPNTSMHAFPLCPQCQAEYQNPADRRFHAQPNACPVCGPQLWLSDGQGEVMATADQAVQMAAQALLAGKIVAVKGIGGFHLACDATNPQAVQCLRLRKHRPAKPLAVMVPDTNWLQACVQVAEISKLLQVLQSPAAPIVLLPEHPQSPLCAEIAPGLGEIGVMLPANPLQHLLLQQVARPLVMTSGNPAGKPPALTNQQALSQLAGIADLWLLHNREIVQRADDSLLRLTEQGTEMLRRARGYVPDAITLPPGFTAQPAVLALGADNKNTFCLLWDDQAVVSQHLGSLGDEATQQQQQQLIALFGEMYGVTPQVVAVDAHPGYLSHQQHQQHQQGKALAKQQGIPCVETFHHHAHLVSCLAEHAWPRHGGKVIGLALDGLGYGMAGQLWGGECLLVDYQHCEHLGGLPAVALPGGDLAAHQPWRNLLAQFLRFVPDWQQLPEASALPQPQATTLARAIERRINSPLASSTGRLFDAVAAALRIVPAQISWEGEAACQLEALAHQGHHANPPVTLPLLGHQLDLATFWRQWLSYRASPAQRAYAFHWALAQGFAQLARSAADKQGIHTVVLSGGVLHNTLLRRLLVQQLAGLQVLLPSRLPAGDGGVALGQALITAAGYHSLSDDKKESIPEFNQ